MTWQKLRKLLHTRRVAVCLLRAEAEHDVVSWRQEQKRRLDWPHALSPLAQTEYS